MRTMRFSHIRARRPGRHTLLDPRWSLPKRPSSGSPFFFPADLFKIVTESSTRCTRYNPCLSPGSWNASASAIALTEAADWEAPDPRAGAGRQEGRHPHLLASWAWPTRPEQRCRPLQWTVAEKEPQHRRAQPCAAEARNPEPSEFLYSPDPEVIMLNSIIPKALRILL